MCPALDRIDIVGKTIHVFRIAVVILHRHFTNQVSLGVLPEKIDRLARQHLFAFIDVLNECHNPLLKAIFLGPPVAFIGELDPQPFVQIGQFPQPQT